MHKFVNVVVLIWKNGQKFPYPYKEGYVLEVAQKMGTLQAIVLEALSPFVIRGNIYFIP
jgi:hypothetical protein